MKKRNESNYQDSDDCGRGHIGNLNTATHHAIRAGLIKRPARAIVTAGIAFFLTLLLVACSSDNSATPEADVPQDNAAVTTADQTEATVLRVAISDFEQGQYDSLIQAFETANPDVKIRTVSIQQALGVNFNNEWPEDAYLTLASAADVLATPATHTAVQQGALLDLEPFIESDPNFEAADFYPGVLESMQWDGGTWSLPTETTYELISYSKPLFDAAGLSYPQPGWTWNDFNSMAQALTIKDGDSVAQWGFVQPTFDPVSLVQARGGLLFDPSTNPPTANFESSPIVEAVTWFTDLILTQQVMPYSPGGGGGPGGGFNNQGLQLIAGDLAAMWQGGFFVFGGPGGFGGQNEDIGVVPFPVESASDHTTPAEVDGLSISAGTAKADLAWKWVSFVAQQRGQQGGAFGGANSSTVPALRSVAASSNFWQNLEESRNAALMFAVDHALIDSYHGVGYDTFSDAVATIVTDGVTVNTALAEAQTAVEAEIDTAVAALEDSEDVTIVVAEEEEAALNAGAVVVQFGLSEGGGFATQSYRRLADQFQVENPDIIIDIKSPAGFGGDQSLSQQASNYDCFQGSPTFNTETDLSAILSMEPFLSADDSIAKDDFYDSVLEQFTYQGQLWGLPGNVNISVVNYNKDLFDAVGQAYPSSDWATSDFLDTAVALSFGEGETQQYGYVSDVSEMNDLVTMLDRLGANIFDDSVDPPRLVFNDPTVVEIVRWYTDLATEYGVRPIFVTEESNAGGGPGRGGPFGGFGGQQARQALINQGQAAMWITSGGGFGGPGGPGGFGGQGQGQTELNIGVAPLPVGSNSDRGSGFRFVDGFFISSQSQVREACWKWITYLTEQSSLGNGLPSRISVAESDAYRQRVGAERAEAYIASIGNSSRASFFQRLSDEDGWLFPSFSFLSDAYNDIMLEDTPVEEALNSAQEKMDTYRSCVIMNDALSDFQALQGCLQEVNGQG